MGRSIPISITSTTLSSFAVHLANMTKVLALILLGLVAIVLSENAEDQSGEIDNISSDNYLELNREIREADPGNSFHSVLTPSIIFCTSCTSEYPNLCLLEMSSVSGLTTRLTTGTTGLQMKLLTSSLQLVNGVSGPSRKVDVKLMLSYQYQDWLGKS